MEENQSPTLSSIEGKLSSLALDQKYQEKAGFFAYFTFLSLDDKHSIIGEGSYGTIVRKAIENETKEEVAVKCIKPKGERLIGEVKREVSLLKKIKHPNILKTFCSFQENGQVLIVSELMKGGDLFDRLLSKEYFSERDAQKVLRCISDALKYLHQSDIVHRDVKPENILLKDSEDFKCVLCDFGFARQINDGCKTDCGTRNYAAPEIHMGKTYGKGVDVWSLGVTLFMMLSGYHPFNTGNTTTTFSNICDGKIMWEAEIWDAMSNESKDLVNKMLTINPAKRISIEEVCEHPWFNIEQ